MFYNWYHRYGFHALLFIACVSLVVVFVYNTCRGERGTYSNHSKNIAMLLGSPVGSSLPTVLTGADGGAVRPPFGGGGNEPFESVGERECRRVVESITGRSFPRQRPNFLRNEVTGANLELDCFNADLRLAIEYNGIQHYSYVPKFHSSPDALMTTRYRDATKRRLCRERGIDLIVVPYTVRANDIEAYVRRAISDVGRADEFGLIDHRGVAAEA